MTITHSDAGKAKSIRGRPRSDARRHVCSALLDAAEAGLRVKGHSQLTSREIASLAHTNQAMIRYYFNGKEGLFCALIEKALESVIDDLTRLEQDLDTLPERPTKALILLLTRHYFSSAPLFKVLMDELRNENSAIRKRYVKRGSRTFAHICRILRKFVKLGIFKPDANVRYAAFTIACLIETPVALSPVISQMGFTIEELKGDAWIDYVSGMLDREFGR